MGCAIMGNLDGRSDKLAFDIQTVKRIVDRRSANLVPGQEKRELLLRVDDRICRVEGGNNGSRLGDYFIVLESWKTFNVHDFQILFDVKESPDLLITGTDVKGERHVCSRHLSKESNREGEAAGEGISPRDMENLKEMIVRLRQGQFYEALTMEFSGKIKEIAHELMDFRQDLQRRFAPGIVDMVEKQIPEASIQLEGINTTLEKSTMKIMDINEGLLDVVNDGRGKLRELLTGGLGETTASRLPEDAASELQTALKAFEKIRELSMSMAEPLSFQDLVGQRIQRIIQLVKSMEARIEDLVISFGIKLQKYKEDPTRSFEDLKMEVEEYKSELRGPQREGEGMDQSAIDDLLASL